MSLRDDLLPVFGDARKLVENFGLRTNALIIRRRAWSGRPGATGSTPTDTDLTLTPRPKIRALSSKEVAGSGGRYEEGDLRVTRITPAYSGGGYTPAQLVPVVGENVQVLYVVTGPEAGEYSLLDSDFSKNFGYELTVGRRRSTP